MIENKRAIGGIFAATAGAVAALAFWLAPGQPVEQRRQVEQAGQVETGTATVTTAPTTTGTETANPGTAGDRGTANDGSGEPAQVEQAPADKVMPPSKPSDDAATEPAADEPPVEAPRPPEGTPTPPANMCTLPDGTQVRCEDWRPGQPSQQVGQP